MMTRFKLTILLFLYFVIIINVSYLLFGLVNFVGLQLISNFYPESTEQLFSDVAIKYNTLITFALVGIIFAWVFITPILHIIHWINLLSNGTYNEPLNRNGIPRSLTKKGEIKYSYLFYKKVLNHLSQLTYTLKENKKDREMAEITKKEWVTNIAHDIKTPLSYIKGYSTMLQSEELIWTNGEKERFINNIRKKAEEMDVLIGDLNDTFKLDHMNMEVEKREEYFEEFIREIVIDTANIPQASKYKFHFYSSIDDSVKYPLNKQLLRRGISNLLTNAVVHNKEGTTIDVQLKMEDSSVVIVINDNGEGMNSDTLNNAFKRYYSNGYIHLNQKGSGLGMSIAKQLIELHTGTVAVDSVIGEGTIIQIKLPLDIKSTL